MKLIKNKLLSSEYTSFIITLGIFAVGISLALESIIKGIPIENWIFPAIVISFLVFFTILEILFLILKNIKYKKMSYKEVKEEIQEEINDDRKGNKSYRVLFTIFLTGVYIVGIYLLGFVLMSLVFGSILVRLYKKPGEKINIFVYIYVNGIMCLLSFIFVYYLKLPFPTGILFQ